MVVSGGLEALDDKLPVEVEDYLNPSNPLPGRFVRLVNQYPADKLVRHRGREFVKPGMPLNDTGEPFRSSLFDYAREYIRKNQRIHGILGYFPSKGGIVIVRDFHTV
jgi:hypothetical protein